MERADAAALVNQWLTQRAGALRETADRADSPGTPPSLSLALQAYAKRLRVIAGMLELPLEF